MLFAWLIHSLPPTIFATVSFASIVYFATGLYPEATRFLIYTSMCFLSYLLGEFVAIFFVRTTGQSRANRAGLGEGRWKRDPARDLAEGGSVGRPGGGPGHAGGLGS